MSLADDVHLNLPLPDCNAIHLIKGNYMYYHYMCDGEDDRGWGCGYRTLQTLCSWICKQQNQQTSENGEEYFNNSVPSIKCIQEALVEIGDKSPDFIGSKQWIGSVEIAFCLEKFYKVLCKIIHVNTTEDLRKQINTLENHFDSYGSPVMMGGNSDGSSKGILGVCRGLDDIYLLVLDPHYVGASYSRKLLQHEEWIKWKPLNSFDKTSFYNLCCPLLKAHEL